MSFDPNLRKEMMSDTSLSSALHAVLAATDIFMPSGSEILMFVQESSEDSAAMRLIDAGVKEVVLKRGAGGSKAFTSEGTFERQAFSVEELDPTGAGDCFGATYVACRHRGMRVEEALLYANAAGARAVSVRGPMEGASTFEQLDALISHQGAAR